MTQLDLVHETFSDALRALVDALGGPKKVGPILRPNLPVDHAATWVRDCLNPARRERFDQDYVLMLLKLGRQADCHVAAQFIARDCGYADMQPIDPEDEKACLMREFNETAKRMERMAARIERLSQPNVRSVA